jgi:lysyl-tRNA synthetase class 2
MDLVQDIFKHIATQLGKLTLEYKEAKIDFSKPFKRISMVNVIKESCGVDFTKITNDQDALKIAHEYKLELAPHQNTRGHVINAFFETYGEKSCIQPTFVYEYPIEISPLAKKEPNDQTMTQRFELFICGKEFANAFSELNDPIDQQQRFQSQLDERALGNTEANEMD